MARNTQEIYRDACRRSHTILANYLALVAWRGRLECVCVARKDLLSYLGLGKVLDRRVELLKEDIKRLFPHVRALRDSSVYLGNVTRTFHSLFIARRDFPADCHTSDL